MVGVCAVRLHCRSAHCPASAEGGPASGGRFFWSLAHLPAWVGGRAGLVACPSMQALSPILGVFFQAGKAGFGFQSVSRVGLTCSGLSPSVFASLRSPPLPYSFDLASRSVDTLRKKRGHKNLFGIILEVISTQ